MKKPDRLVKRNAQEVRLALTDDPEPFLLAVQTLVGLLSVFLVAASLLVVPVDVDVEVQLGGLVSACVPSNILFPVIGSAKTDLLFAGSWAWTIPRSS